MQARFLAVVVLSAACGVANAKDEGGKEAELLAGTWGITAAREAGREWSVDCVPSARLVLKGSKCSVTFGPVILLEGTATVDATRAPKTIDLKCTGGRYEGKTLAGIYENKGNLLKVCFAEPESKRPGEFSSTARSKTYLFECDQQAADWFSQWHYDKKNIIAPPRSPTIFVRSASTPDDFQQVLKYYQGVINKNSRLKFALSNGMEEMAPDIQSSDSSSARITVEPQLATMCAQRFKVKIDTEVHVFTLSRDDSSVTGGTDAARRPVSVHVFTQDSKDYTVTVVITRARDEKNTHIVATFVTR